RFGNSCHKRITGLGRIRRCLVDRLKWPRGWEIRRGGSAGDRNVSARVQGDRAGGFVPSAAEVCREENSGSRTIQFSHKGVASATRGGLNGTDQWKIRRRGTAGNVGISEIVHGNSETCVRPVATQICGINE